jgi:hypothetical protein
MAKANMICHDRINHHQASTDGWDLLAKGKVTGRGIGRYTSIPEEMFTPVDIPGRGGEGGTRAFYLTMDSNNLVYKTGEGTASDSAVQMETEDIQIWEGEVSCGYFLCAWKAARLFYHPHFNTGSFGPSFA